MTGKKLFTDERMYRKKFSGRWPVKRFFIWLLPVLLSGAGCKNGISSSPDEKIVEDMAHRLIPAQADHFRFHIIKDSADYFELESREGKIGITANSTNSAAAGLNYYLKNYCNTTVTWYADDAVVMPEQLPVIGEKVKVKARIPQRFFLNYCTFGYTMPWWKWKDWERLIDWMALHGINLPLAITGQEASWQKVWKQFGMSDSVIRASFTGPAHLPWNRMSNMDRWGGPLPQSWIDQQVDLQKQILQRERSLGMTPVLPAFSGHVPKALKDARPAAKISQLGAWGDFEDDYRTYYLDPLDSLFPQIQKAFLEEQNKLFGTDHIYGIDPFNEVAPPSWEPSYLAQVSKTIYSSLLQTDPDAVWLQMAWIFYFERQNWTNERIKAMTSAVPPNKMWLLDYYCEKTEVWKMTESFFGQPFIWCYLGNFGGNTMLNGNLDTVHQRIENTYINGGANFNGIGSTLEGFDANPIMYEYLFEKTWDYTKNLTPEKWISMWSDMRTGMADENVRKGWAILLDKVYQHPCELGKATLTNSRPSLTGSGNWTTNTHIDYDNKDLLTAWGLLLKSNMTNRPGYQFDIVNTGRQVLGNYFTQLRDSFTGAYQKKDIATMEQNREKMMGLFDDMDALLSTQSAFLTGKWINDARMFGADDSEKDYYEKNARNLITTWGYKRKSLNEYANRGWAGLMKGYYKERWKMFTTEVIAAVKTNRPFDEKAFYQHVTDFEWDWVKQHDKYASSPEGNAIEIAGRLFSKYENEIMNGGEMKE